MIHEVGQNLTGVHVARNSSFWNSDNQIFAATTMQILALAVHSIFGATVGMIAKCK